MDVYKAEIAQKRAQKRKANSRKTKKLSDNKLQHYFIRKLKDGWPPEIVAHVWNSLNYKECTCIYNFINQRRIELIQCAERKYKNRYKSIKTLISEYDNGTENVLHNEINKILGCESYFCRPYCSQDKWQVENRNIDDFSPRKQILT